MSQITMLQLCKSVVICFQNVNQIVQQFSLWVSQ